MWWLVFILFCAGVALILAEFFVPGGVIGILGAILLVSSCTYGWYAFPDYGVPIVIAEVVGTSLSIVLGMVIISRTGAAGFMILEDSQRNDEGWSSPHADESLEGKIGEVHSALRPAGTVMIGGERINAVSDAQFIEKGKRVRVIEVEGHRVVVEPVEEDEEIAGAQEA